jgi:G:T/U-mismatch repair DNA glycosylase
MFDYFGEPFSTDYEKRVNLLLKNGIALWDSVERCQRVGSLDSAIKNEAMLLTKAKELFK